MLWVVDGKEWWVAVASIAPTQPLLCGLAPLGVEPAGDNNREEEDNRAEVERNDSNAAVQFAEGADSFCQLVEVQTLSMEKKSNLSPGKEDDRNAMDWRSIVREELEVK